MEVMAVGGVGEEPESPLQRVPRSNLRQLAATWVRVLLESLAHVPDYFSGRGLS